jgi:hypothetical protein
MTLPPHAFFYCEGDLICEGTESEHVRFEGMQSFSFILELAGDSSQSDFAYCNFDCGVTMYAEAMASFDHCKFVKGLSLYTATADLTYCSIGNNADTGIRVGTGVSHEIDTSLTVQHSEIAGVEHAVIVADPNSTVTVSDSNIYINPADFNVDDTLHVEAPNNWWGTTDTAVIDSCIDASVNYTPIRTEIVADAGCGW